MRSPAHAIAWEFRRRHLWALIALAGYLLALAAVSLFGFGPVEPITLDPPDGRAALVVVPLSATFFYYLAVFSFGFSGDLAARQSIFPTRLFALPVTTRALVGWPMLYGTTISATLWLATATFARWPWGIDLPFVWPALLAASFLAWTQALMWMPYGLPGMRAIVTVLWLAALDAFVLLALYYKATERLMVAILAPQIPLAYLTARLAVARARRGDVPDWRGLFGRLGGIANLREGRREHFPSASRAQLWFEWRRHGRSLPMWVAILLPFELATLYAARNDPPALIFYALLAILLTPPIIAGFAASTVSEFHPARRDAYGMSPFSATRPMTSAELVAAKLKMTIWSTLAAWLLVCVAIPLGLTLTHTWPVVIQWAHQSSKTVGTSRTIVLGMLGLSALVTATWKQLVQSLYIGLTGREWVIKSNMILVLSLFIMIGPLAQWIIESGHVRAVLWIDLPWILAALVSLKMSAASWIALRLYDGRLVSDRVLVTGAASWLLAMLALYGALAWFFSTPHVPGYLLVLVAIMAIPLARLSAAPLALAWNRHR